MDALSTLLEELKQGEQTQGNFLGFLNVLVGRRISGKGGVVISKGLSWRELSVWLKKVRWDPDQVKELGLNPDDLPPRDRQRYWYAAIIAARVDTPESRSLGDEYARI